MSGLSVALANKHGLETKHVKVETCTTLTCLVHPYNEETEEGSLGIIDRCSSHYKYETIRRARAGTPGPDNMVGR